MQNRQNWKREEERKDYINEHGLHDSSRVPYRGQRISFLKKAPNSSERPHPKAFSSPRTAGKRRRTRGRVIRPERSGGWASTATGKVPIRECATLVGKHDCAESKPAVRRSFFHARGYPKYQYCTEPSEGPSTSINGSSQHVKKKKTLPPFASRDLNQTKHLLPSPSRPGLGDSFVIF